MQKNVHALLIGSIDFDLVSRPIGLFRLRTSAEDSGFNAEVIAFKTNEGLLYVAIKT